MSDIAAIRATFADYKRIKTRKVAQLVFEVPLELLHDTIAKLGGEPALHEETWCAIARLNLADASTREDEGLTGTPVQNNLGQSNTTSAAKPKREMTLPEKVGMFCNNAKFQKFLEEKIDWWRICAANYDSADRAKIAASVVRSFCNVKSRKEILPDTEAQKEWSQLFNSFQSSLQSQT